MITINNQNFTSIVESLFALFPLFKKKLIKPKAKQDIDLSPSHFKILFLINDLGKIPISEIAKNLHIAKSNMTPLIQKLIDKGYIERIRDKNDRRYINIALTKAGQEFIEEHKKIIANDLKKRLTVLSQEDLEQLSVSLNNVKRIISKLD
ncbi:transcriptional regulator [Halobacteroides halobius DSM 5150]|uniref:Transcriptional regulator n=1 Tax=Halobacteroides halobius (strain ATCC 35273 / DSM 5150 / MD-1) TaxID=748449 RepID=L0KAR0_HALHC|nr:MarR family transcriptional regulator [Halobacteroides halobius]AGB41630.1 transcriptional regulator [Halobacteroides halobius DSM 5150]